MARFCSSCGAALPDNANNCPSCGKAAAQSVGGGAAAAPAAATASGGLADNVAGLLCYVPFLIGLIASIAFLVLEPYNRNKFVKFHAFQSLFTHVAVFVLMFALGILGGILSAMMPFLGLLILPLDGLIGLGCLLLVLLLMYKAYQNETYRLPFVGDLAAKQAGL